MDRIIPLSSFGYRDSALGSKVRQGSIALGNRGALPYVPKEPVDVRHRPVTVAVTGLGKWCRGTRACRTRSESETSEAVL